ncbi:MAG: PVC-type heme-binding CxxCH protein [Pirellulales bacterium]
MTGCSARLVCVSSWIKLGSRIAIAAWLLVAASIAATRCTAQPPDSLDRDYRDELVEFPALELGQALKSFEVADGLRVEVVAAEPEVTDPVAMAFDERGRLYVVEMRGYSEQADEHLSRVRLLTDVDGDGRYEQSQTFAEGLDWPTGIAVVDGGVYVAAAPDILFLRDNDGDGRADERRVIATGFGRQNVQAMLNNLHWGLDNWLHGATSNNPATVTVSAAESNGRQASPVRLDGRDFALHPRSQTLRIEAGGGQHGLTFDAWGHKFVCSNSDHLRQVVGDDQQLARNPWLLVPATSQSIAEDGPAAEVYRISPVEPWRVVRTRLRVQGLVPGPVEGGGRAAGYFTSATGVTVYTGDHLPLAYRGRVFVGDVGSNLVHQKSLQWNGLLAVGKRVDQQTEFLRSSDTWFRPVQMANGPDGALYVLDMYRQVIEHPWSLPPLIKRHLDLTKGRDRGRIYRIVRSDQRPAQRRLPGDVGPGEQIDMLQHTNGWHRLTAARLLCERPALEMVDRLESLIGTVGEDEPAAAGRIHALYVLADWQRLDSATLNVALQDPHPQVRRHAVRLCRGRWAQDNVLKQRLLAMTGDGDGEVRYELAYTLGGSADPEVVRGLLKLVDRDADEPWVTLAALSGMHPMQPIVWRQVVDLTAGGNKAGSLRPATSRRLLVELARQILQSGDADRELANQLPGLLSALSHEAPQLIDELLWETLSGGASDGALRLIRATESGAESGEWQRSWARTLKRARHVAVAGTEVDRAEPLPLVLRIEAVRVLAAFGWAESGQTLQELLAPQQPAELQSQAIDGLLRSAGEHYGEVAGWLAGQLSQLTPEVRRRAVAALLDRPAAAETWIDHLDEASRRVMAGDLQIVQQLRTSPSPQIRQLAEQLVPAVSSDMAALIERYSAALTELSAAANDNALAAGVQRGQELFTKHCVNCHGPQPIGPPVEVLKTRNEQQLTTALLDPNREVDPRYEVYQIELVDGRVLSGVLVSENATSISLGLATGERRSVLRGEIDRLTGTGRSLMPEGFHRELDPAGLHALLLYLRRP